MGRLFAIVKKECILLGRDLPGLIILFLMPVLLIFVVTLAQENALRMQERKTTILLAGNPENPLLPALQAAFDSSGFFDVITAKDGSKLQIPEARNLVQSGEYGFAVLAAARDSALVILSDPTLKDSYRATVTSSLVFIIRATQGRDVMNQILGGLPPDMQPVVTAMVEGRMKSLPPVRESYALRERSTIQPNVIQNNVPGFILFAMFFIVIPLAGSIIAEKTEGSYQRLRSLPVKMASVLGGKVVVYLVVCLFQFLLMMFIGTWIFPHFFGFPPLEFGNQYFAILIATIAAALAAIGFGLVTGAFATTHNQAALFGSVMVVLLGVVSGTFLPIHVMPKAIQAFSLISPVRWGIDNYLELFVREGGIQAILPGTFLLLLFFGLSMIVSLVIFAKNFR